MTLDLPAPLAGFFAAKNAHDTDAMVASFADDAMVRDEGRDMRGHPAIRAWVVETSRKYKVRAEPKEIDKTEGFIVVTTRVSGTFPGSPIDLRFRFQIEAGKISKLEIGT